MKTVFYLCPICGNIVTKIEDGGPIPHCCGQQMKILIPGTTEASAEKHIPVLETIDEQNVIIKVGSEEHPMTERHHINWIWVETCNGGHLYYLTLEGKIAEKATIKCQICKKNIIAVYAYCNIHGLWKCDIKECFQAKGIMETVMDGQIENCRTNSSKCSTKH